MGKLNQYLGAKGVKGEGRGGAGSKSGRMCCAGGPSRGGRGRSGRRRHVRERGVYGEDEDDGDMSRMKRNDCRRLDRLERKATGLNGSTKHLSQSQVLSACLPYYTAARPSRHSATTSVQPGESGKFSEAHTHTHTHSLTHAGVPPPMHARLARRSKRDARHLRPAWKRKRRHLSRAEKGSMAAGSWRLRLAECLRPPPLLPLSSSRVGCWVPAPTPSVWFPRLPRNCFCFGPAGPSASRPVASAYGCLTEGGKQ